MEFSMIAVMTKPPASLLPTTKLTEMMKVMKHLHLLIVHGVS